LLKTADSAHYVRYFKIAGLVKLIFTGMTVSTPWLQYKYIEI